MHTQPSRSVRGRRCPTEPPSSWLVGGGIEILWPKESSPLRQEEWKNYCLDRERIKFYSHSYNHAAGEGPCEVEWNSNGIIYRTRWRPAALDRRTSRKRRPKQQGTTSSDVSLDRLASTRGRKKNVDTTAAAAAPAAVAAFSHTSIYARESPRYPDLLKIASEAAFAAIQRVERERSVHEGINAVSSDDSDDDDDDDDDDTSVLLSAQGRMKKLRASKVFNATTFQAAAKTVALESAPEDGRAEGDNDNAEYLCKGIKDQVLVNRDLWEQCKSSVTKRPSGEHPQSVRTTHAEGEDDDEESKGFMSFERSYARIKVVCKDDNGKQGDKEKSKQVKTMLRGLLKRGLAKQMPSQFLHLETEQSEPVHVMLRGLAKNVPNQFVEFISPKEETSEGFIVDYKIAKVNMG